MAGGGGCTPATLMAHRTALQAIYSEDEHRPIFLAGTDLDGSGIIDRLLCFALLIDALATLGVLSIHLHLYGIYLIQGSRLGRGFPFTATLGFGVSGQKI